MAAAAAAALEAPTAALYVDLPGEGTLQMCVMRPTAQEVCPALPLLVPPPEPEQLLRAAAARPRVLPASDIVGCDDDVGENSAQAPADGGVGIA